MRRIIISEKEKEKSCSNSRNDEKKRKEPPSNYVTDPEKSSGVTCWTADRNKVNDCREIA
jgi:hypothetical protein